MLPRGKESAGGGGLALARAAIMASVRRLGIPAQEQSAIMPDVRIFVSGAQTEFVWERASLHYFLRGASTAQRFFESSRFEKLGEQYRRPDQADRQETGKDHVYVGLLGIEYANEDEHIPRRTRV